LKFQEIKASANNVASLEKLDMERETIRIIAWEYSQWKAMWKIQIDFFSAVEDGNKIRRDLIIKKPDKVL
jgi:hypothetical protein